MEVSGDESFTTLLLILVGAVAFAVLVYMAKKRSTAQRIEALTSMAARLRFRFRPEGDDQLRTSLGDLPLFRQGRNHQLTDLLDDSGDYPGLAFFDYEFMIGAGRNRREVSQMVACFEVNSPGFPDFSLRPESLGDKIATTFGGQDVDFESRPDFSKKYRLTGSDETAIRNLFSERVLGQLEQLDKCSIEASRAHIIFYRHGRKPHPEEFEAFARLAKDTLAMLAERRG